jgi:hypothetical protein
MSKINCPAIEKILSDGTEVATKLKYFFASLLSTVEPLYNESRL